MYQENWGPITERQIPGIWSRTMLRDPIRSIRLHYYMVQHELGAINLLNK